MTNAITTVQEGKKRLAKLEKRAGVSYRASKEAFDTFVLTLHQIREERAWHYAVDLDGVMLGDLREPLFKRHYLVLFCQKHGISVASVYEHLGTVDTCIALGRDKEWLADPNVGVAAAGGIKEIVHYDRRKGELILPTENEIENLPGSKEDDPIERLNIKIDEVFSGDEPPAPAVVRKSFAVDVADRPDASFWQSGGKDGGDIWFTYTRSGVSDEKKLIPGALFKELTPEMFEYLRARLGIQLYE